MEPKNLKIEKQILDRLNVKHRLEELYAQHSSNESRLEKTDKTIAINIFDKLGYKVKYYTREKFYQITKNDSESKSLCHFILRYGTVEIVMYFKVNDEYVFGGPMGWILRPYVPEEEFKPILDPRFSSYEELEEIIKKTLNMFEDIYQEIKQLSNNINEI